MWNIFKSFWLNGDNKSLIVIENFKKREEKSILQRKLNKQ